MSKKIIISFEGIEGSGKTYHIKNVSNHIKKNRVPHIKLRQPGGSKNAEKIRKIILNKKNIFNNKTDLLLYLAARNENIENIIKKNHKKKIILIDRFTDSTIAYQHFGMGLNKKIINIINNYLLNKIRVNYTFLHIVSQKNLKTRLLKRKTLNRYDKFNYSFYKKVQKGFIKQANLKSKKYLIIDSNNKINENKKIIINKINNLINL